MIKIRTCIICRGKNNKGDLLRIVKSKDGGIDIDENQKLFGRSAYVCNDPACIKKCVDKKMLNRAFKCNVNADIYEKLINRGENLGGEQR